jgi:single-strand DNA-binding protein
LKSIFKKKAAFIVFIKIFSTFKGIILLIAIIMRGVNKVTLIGNVGKDPEIQTLEGNLVVAKFPLATTENHKDKNGNTVSNTEWHTVVLWRGLAELAQKFLHKGSMIYVEGRIRYRNWEDKDKIKRTSTEIVADNFVMLDKRKENEGRSETTEIITDDSFDKLEDNLSF